MPQAYHRRMHLDLSDEQHRRLNRAAKRQGVTMTTLARSAIISYLCAQDEIVRREEAYSILKSKVEKEASATDLAEIVFPTDPLSSHPELTRLMEYVSGSRDREERRARLVAAREIVSILYPAERKRIVRLLFAEVQD